MRITPATRLGIPFVIALLLTGCGGGGTTVEATSTTMGQELMDLNASYQKGIITEEEYERAKKAIMKRYQ